MVKIDTTALLAILEIIDRKMQGRSMGHNQLAKFLKLLCTIHGGSFQGRSVGECSLRLAGVRSTCTYGVFGVTSNWVRAAGRKIAEAAK